MIMEDIINEYETSLNNYNAIIDNINNLDSEIFCKYSEKKIGNMFEDIKHIYNKEKEIVNIYNKTFVKEFLILAESCINYGVTFNITSCIYFSIRKDFSVSLDKKLRKKKQTSWRDSYQRKLVDEIVASEFIHCNYGNKRYNKKNIAYLINVIDKLREIDINKDANTDMIIDNVEISLSYSDYPEVLFTKNYNTVYLRENTSNNEKMEVIKSFSFLKKYKEELLNNVSDNKKLIETRSDKLNNLIEEMHEYNKTFIVFQKLEA